MRSTMFAILALTPALSWACTNDVLVGAPDGTEEDAEEEWDWARGAARFVPCGNCGEALGGLDKARLAEFEEGLEEFEEEETVEEGIGPVFNEASCVACHDTPAPGGSGTTVETRFGAIAANGLFDAMPEFGGSLRQDKGVGELGTCGLGPELTPVRATIEAGRRTTPLFGLGLVDAVPDRTLQLIAIRQPGAIRGIAHQVVDVASGKVRVGRFGWKAQVATLQTFAGDAYLNEMGITSPDFPVENCPQGDCTLLATCDGVPDPEDDGEALDGFASFMTLLAPPAPGSRSIQARRGGRLFGDLGCAGCHVPTLVTGRSDIPQLDRVQLHPFSDFLLHDMGSLGDGITQGQATGRLMRTAPLWGVAAQPLLLHDGRTSSLGQAIRAHDGQAASARDRFVRMRLADRQAVIAFLRTL